MSVFYCTCETATPAPPCLALESRPPQPTQNRTTTRKPTMPFIPIMIVIAIIILSTSWKNLDKLRFTVDFNHPLPPCPCWSEITWYWQETPAFQRSPLPAHLRWLATCNPERSRCIAIECAASAASRDTFVSHNACLAIVVAIAIAIAIDIDIVIIVIDIAFTMVDVGVLVLTEDV